MKYEEYIQNVLSRFQRHFDIFEKYNIENYIFDFAAIFKERNERYFASKKIVLDAIENKEFCLFKHQDTINNEQFAELAKALEASVNSFVNPTSEHMSTFITCIIIIENISDNSIIPNVRKYRYNKSFFFNLRGWAKIRFILVDLSLEKIYSSKEGDKVKKIYDFSF